MTAVAIEPQDLDVLFSAKDYYQRLLSLIAGAQQRIYIAALYLEDDDAGRQVLTALYQAKQDNPQLDICIFVDAHRAQRGLIGQAQSLGNRAMYQEFAQQFNEKINIFGIAVKSKELLGVLHLKGMVFDHTVFYSGASINNVYLQHQEKYRLDRYYQIHSPNLADSFVNYLTDSFLLSGLAIDLTSEVKLTSKQQKSISKRTIAMVRRARYQLNDDSIDASISITPLVGCGRRANQLNHHICQLLKQSQQTIVLFTPYFNLPHVVIKQLVRALKRGVRVTIVVGDKTASDFFIAPSKPFSTIGVIPYIYEQILRRFIKRWQRYIDNEQLTINLWSDGDNSYHAKGIVVDDRWHLMTGSNLNPRAWGLDLENGLLIDDRQQAISALFDKEYLVIARNLTRVNHYQQLESLQDYPEKPKKLLRRLTLSKIDRLLKRFL